MHIRQLAPLLLTLVLAPAFAAAPAVVAKSMPAKAPTAQQQRMSTCSAQNKGRKGADYKAAQSACLKGQTTAAAAPGRTAQQQRMATCSAKNKGKKGADFKTAQASCLSSR